MPGAGPDPNSHPGTGPSCGTAPDSYATSLRVAALFDASVHLDGRCRAFLMELEHYAEEVRAAQDPRAAQLLASLEATGAMPPVPGTVRHIQLAAKALRREIGMGRR